MDPVARLIERAALCALMLAVLLVPGVAWAYGTVSQQTIPAGVKFAYAMATWGLSSDYIYADQGVACSAGLGAYMAARPNSGSPRQTSVNASGCGYSFTCKDGVSSCGTLSVATPSAMMPPKTSCPSGSAQLANGSCECLLNFKAMPDGSCQRYDCPAKGSYNSQVSPDVKVSNVGDSHCSGGCSVTPSSWKVDQEGQIWGVWPMKSTNQACGGKKDAGGAATGDDQLPEAPVACPANQCPGSINGTSVCVPCKSSTTPGPSTTASGAQPGDPPKNPSDPDTAVKGSTSQTTCVGAICTTVTKFFDGKGNEVGSKTEEQPETDYCQKNPASPQCKKDSFGGACEGGFTCEGDAVQCALAKEVHVRNCQWFKEPAKVILDAGDRALAAGDRPPGHPAGEPETRTFALSSLIDMSNPIPGSCPSDVTVAVGGAVYVVPFSRMCSSLELIGRAMVAMCLLAAAGIVFRGS